MTLSQIQDLIFLAAVDSLPGVRVEVDADGYCWMTDEKED